MNTKLNTIDHPYLCGVCNYIAIDIWYQASHLKIEHNQLYEIFDYAMSIGAQDPYGAMKIFEEMIDDDPVTLIYKLNLELIEIANASNVNVGLEYYGRNIDVKLLKSSINRLNEYIKDYPNAIELYGLGWISWKNYSKALLCFEKNYVIPIWNALKLNKFSYNIWKHLLISLVTFNPDEKTT
ncbi:MAG: hypothetical protein HOA12_06445 [Candidatus Marinimicrobia bacterium]|jgi:hypothetical protein|nr:hypothetical protein [Candidatus Neomarinimicrobiota bacterium]MBT6862872.1 hypothetical protein [Candidatus Neomarinimicrobiota bacterium]